jgi:hypothetical protein
LNKKIKNNFSKKTMEIKSFYYYDNMDLNISNKKSDYLNKFISFKDKNSKIYNFYKKKIKSF